MELIYFLISFRIMDTYLYVNIGDMALPGRMQNVVDNYVLSRQHMMDHLLMEQFSMVILRNSSILHFHGLEHIKDFNALNQPNRMP